MINSIQDFRYWLMFLFDINLGLFFPRDIMIASISGLGYGAPRCSRFRNVLRYEWDLLLGLVCILTLIAGMLYYKISPEHIYDPEYTLALLYTFYATAVIVLMYQWWRELDWPSTEQLRLPFEECAICRASAPRDDLITLQCDENNQAQHCFHEICLLLAWAAAEPLGTTLCPLCRRVPLGYRRTYSVVESNILDNSRLMWYITSLFFRRTPLIIRRWYKFEEFPEDHMTTNAIRERRYRIALFRVLPTHALAMTSLILLTHYIYRLLLLPLPWPAWLVVVGPITGALFYQTTEIAAVQYYHTTQQGQPRPGFCNVVMWFSLWIEYFYPSATPPRLLQPLRAFVFQQWLFAKAQSGVFISRVLSQVFFHILHKAFNFTFFAVLALVAYHCVAVVISQDLVPY